MNKTSKIILIIILILLFENCKEKSINEEYEKINLNYKIKHDCCLNIPKLEFIEKREVEIKDNILIFGGDKSFLKNYLKCDTCNGRIVDIVFSKPIGNNAIVKFSNNDLLYSISLNFKNYKSDYSTTLRVWEKKMNIKEKMECSTN